MKTEWISDIDKNASKWNHQLKKKCGMDFMEIAAKASGRKLSELEWLRERTKIAVVPVTVGLGVISSFAKSVAATPTAMGFETFVTKKSDIDGLFEAFMRGASIVFVADDDRYLAMNLNERKMGDNNEATAAGYVAVLEGLLQNKGNLITDKEHILKGREVLLLGYGLVGKHAAEKLMQIGAMVTVYEKNPTAREAAAERGFFLLQDKAQIKAYPVILDATCEGAWITEDMLDPDFLMATPGVPLSIEEATSQKFEDRIIHDYLEIGTAVMLAMAL